MNTIQVFIWIIANWRSPLVPFFHWTVSYTSWRSRLVCCPQSSVLYARGKLSLSEGDLSGCPWETRQKLEISSTILEVPICKDAQLVRKSWSVDSVFSASLGHVMVAGVRHCMLLWHRQLRYFIIWPVCTIWAFIRASYLCCRKNTRTLIRCITKPTSRGSRGFFRRRHSLHEKRAFTSGRE